MKGHVHIGATTGKAANYFNGPTVHSMFGISQNDFNEGSMPLNVSSKKCAGNKLIYEDVDLFIIDEVGMMPSHVLGFISEIMTLSFNSNKLKKHTKEVFGGKRVIFAGGLAQLSPVDGQSFYTSGTNTASVRQRISDQV